MWEDLQSRVGEQVTVVGTAQNAAAGAIVSLDGRPVYVSQLEQWPPELVGRKVEVSGVLAFYPAPPAEGRHHPQAQRLLCARGRVLERHRMTAPAA